jgi:hypothetical protein
MYSLLYTLERFVHTLKKINSFLLKPNPPTEKMFLLPVKPQISYQKGLHLVQNFSLILQTIINHDLFKLINHTFARTRGWERALLLESGNVPLYFLLVAYHVVLLFTNNTDIMLENEI